jgi:tetratricopeptide (TPR) repeat protein
MAPELLSELKQLTSDLANTTSATPAPPESTPKVVLPASVSDDDAAAKTLLRALELAPTDGRNYAALAQWELEARASASASGSTSKAPRTISTTPSAIPLATVEALFEQAVALLPLDGNLRFRYSNAIQQRLDAAHHGLEGDRSEKHLKALRRRWVASLRACIQLDGGRWSPSVYSNLGSALKMMGRDRESEKVYRRGLKLTWPLEAALEATTAIQRGLKASGVASVAVVDAAAVDALGSVSTRDEGARDGGSDVRQGQQISWEMVAPRRRLNEAVVQWRSLPQAQRDEGTRMLQGLHDVSLQHGARRSVHTRAIQQLGVALGVWENAEQMPKGYGEKKLLLACPWLRSGAFGELISELEREAEPIANEMMASLRRRADGDGLEVVEWYADHERIAARPLLWMRRHVGCRPAHLAARFRRTCEAIERAMRWYYSPESKGSSDADGRGDPKDPKAATAANAHANHPTTATRTVGASHRQGAVDPDEFYLKAQYSILLGGSHVRPHHGPTNTRLAISLGLAGLETAELRVGNRTRRWREGEALVFDDAFEHEVRVRGKDPRAVCIIHFPHPQLMPNGTNGWHIGQHNSDELCYGDNGEDGSWYSPRVGGLAEF